MFDTSMFDLAPRAREGAMVRGDKYRFTVLTPRLIRMEYSPDGKFEDRATRLAFRRDFPVPEYTVREEGGRLWIKTEFLELYYDKGPFSPGGLGVYVLDMVKHKVANWNYAQPQCTIHNKSTNRGGTVSTLDNVDGEVELEPGLLDRHGFVVLDDSKTLALNDEGWFEPVEGERIDLYFFGNGWDGPGTLKTFCALSGKVPMIPRWALGNWWSRYWKYTEKSYQELVENFAAHGVPLSVAVIDMDWHITKLPEGNGDGWSVHTWNRDFFPDPPRFLNWLHEHGLKTTLNLHPHSGIRPFEEHYADAARAMGMDPADEKPVRFDASDAKFFRTYFDQVRHPLEDEGVDFWWLDWQQRGGFFKNGYDPLWMLNHYFYTDNARKGGYPMTFSRYAGLGSHRYPIGFSGDSVMSWESLDFQPYFTATASNVAYGWWSHDVGGHTRGEWSDEMQLRWLQYGVFSPIVRPHSTSHPFMLKEPWNFPPAIEAQMVKWFRLRHELIPYLYTMTYRAHHDDLPLILPLYYEWPKETINLLDYRNVYRFGTELLVCPITSPMDPESQTGKAPAWLPEGTWIDIFNHRVYRGGKTMDLYRPLEDYPVLAKAGAILPLDPDPQNGAPLPENLCLQVFCGADGAFRLYEDNGERVGNRAAFTPFSFTWGKDASFTIAPVEGDVSVTLPQRTYRVKFIALEQPETVTLFVNGKERKAEYRWDEATHTLTVSGITLTPADRAELRLATSGKLYTNDFKAEIMARMVRYQTENLWKLAVYNALNACQDRLQLAAQLAPLTENRYILGEIMEILSAGE